MLEGLTLKNTRRTVRSLLRDLKNRIYSTTETRIYACHKAAIGAKSLKSHPIRKDHWADLEKFDQHSGWVTRAKFLAEAESRLLAGEHVYTIVENGCLLHYGWLVVPAETRYILEADQIVHFPPDSAYAYDFFTHPNARNQGLYQSSLWHILRHVTRTTELRDLYIAVGSHGPSRYVVEKLGFRYCRSLFVKWRWGRAKRWNGS